MKLLQVSVLLGHSSNFGIESHSIWILGSRVLDRVPHFASLGRKENGLLRK